MKILYFASLREGLGLSGEDLDVPPACTVKALRAHLAARGGVWREQFDDGRLIRAAVNQVLAADDSAIGPGDEVAFFPPVTGG